MHMPGHKGNTSFVPPYLKQDITEIPGFDNLHAPSGIIKDIEDDAAALWGARSSIISVNGATAPVLASVMAAASLGKVLIASNCHISVWHALEISGADFSVIDPLTDPRLPFCTDVDSAKIRKALRDDPSIKSVVITSPTYEGVISDIDSIGQAARESGVILIVDASHGSHLGLDEYFPKTPEADVVIKSLHKTLHSPTQTALLLTYSDRLDISLIRHYMDVFETSSPSYILMSGIARVIDDLKNNRQLTLPWTTALCSCREVLGNELRHIKLFEMEGADPSKLVILTGGVISGNDLAAALMRDKITVEASYDDYVIAMTGIGDDETSLTRFASALLKEDALLDGTVETQYEEAVPHSEFRMKLKIKDAVEAPFESVPLDGCEGRISASYVFKYPPGIPVLIPGQTITKDRLKLISDAALKVVSG